MSDQQQWTDIDDYFTALLSPADDALQAALRTSDEAGLPRISIAPNQGKFLHLLALTRNAHRILEIGTLGGYSAIWLARALPADGRLITLEYEPRHAEVARGNLARAGLEKVAEVRVGPAVDTLAQLAAEQVPPFDLVFIDADKGSYPEYLEWSVRLAGPGALIIADNVVRGGAVIDADSEQPAVQGVRRYLQLMAEHPRLSGTALQTVGSKGYDGFALARVAA